MIDKPLTFLVSAMDLGTAMPRHNAVLASMPKLFVVHRRAPGQWVIVMTLRSGRQYEAVYTVGSAALEAVGLALDVRYFFGYPR